LTLLATEWARNVRPAACSSSQLREKEALERQVRELKLVSPSSPKKEDEFGELKKQAEQDRTQEQKLAEEGEKKSTASVEPSEKTEMLAKAFKDAKSKKDVALMKELKPKLQESQRMDEAASILPGYTS